MCYDCWGFSDVERRDFRSGKTQPEFGWADTPHKKATKKKPKKKREPCPGNDGKGHIYVKVTRIVTYPDYGWGPYAYEYTYYACCGCMKPRRSRGIYRRIKL